MRITIVAAGNMGRGIGTRAVAGGHEVEIVDRVAGKVVVDITNPVDTQTWDRLATPPGASLQQPHELEFASALKLHP